jgi:hypothetical protein
MSEMSMWSRSRGLRLDVRVFIWLVAWVIPVWLRTERGKRWTEEQDKQARKA